MASLSPNWVERTQSCISCIEGDRKIKINIWWNFRIHVFTEHHLWLIINAQAYCYRPELSNFDKIVTLSNGLAWCIKFSFYWSFYSRHFSGISRTLRHLGHPRIIEDGALCFRINSPCSHLKILWKRLAELVEEKNLALPLIFFVKVKLE